MHKLPASSSYPNFRRKSSFPTPRLSQEWLPHGLPTCNMLADCARALLRTGGLAAPLWCPVPELGPTTAPGTHILEWEPGKEGRRLQLRTVLLSAEVEWVERREVVQVVVEPVPKAVPRARKK